MLKLQSSPSVTRMERAFDDQGVGSEAGLRLDYHATSRNAFNNRVRRLVKHQYLVRDEIALRRDGYVYSISDSGASELIGLGEYYTGPTRRPKDGQLPRGVYHALELNQIHLALKRSQQLHWLVGDITEIEMEPRAYDLWHDRAVFHFLTTPDQRIAYVRQVARSVKPGGHIIVSTFGPEGPTKCSGLDVMRYDAESLHVEFGQRFRLIESSKELHHTPFGTTQQFLYCYCRID